MRTLAALLLIALAPSANAGETSPGPESRTRLDVTVYTNDLALIRDERTAALAPGVNRLVFRGVSPQMIQDSAIVLGGDSVRTTSIDYEFATLTPEALLRRSVGQAVGVVRVHPTSGEETVEQATVLSADGGVVLRYRDRIETGIPGRLVFDRLPEDLRAEPALVAGIVANAAGNRRLELSYLTTGLSWQPDYVVELHEADDRLDLIGRAMVTNVSGAEFANANLGLVAGQIRRVSPPIRPKTRGEMMAVTAGAPAAGEPEALGDLHLYAFPAPVTLADQQTKQLALLTLEKIPVSREYVSEQAQPTYGPESREPRSSHPRLSLRFANPAQGAGGVPLPASVTRIYTRDAQGSVRLVGEDRMTDTPAGGDVELSPGWAFDVTVERRQTDFKRVDLPEGVYESAWNIEARNAKDRPVTVMIVETIPGDWQILAESMAHTRESANRALWALEVPAGGATALEYRVRVHQ